MVDPDRDRTPNPRTLSTQYPDAAAPGSVPLVQEQPASTKGQARQEEDLFYGVLSDYNRQGRVLAVDKATGRIYELMEPDDGEEGDWRAGLIGGSGGSGGKSFSSEAAQDAQVYYDNWQMALRDLDREVEDAKEAKAAGGTARSYLDTEADKTAEITRQFKDFDNRASLLYDLMGDEQDFAMSADDQNIQNAAAREKGYLLPGRGLDYSPYVSGGPLSDILRPSLPNYVRPDYRLNGAVGLPGPQGFDDPDYDPNGLPMFAYGTGAQADTWFPGAVPTAGLPGQLPSMDYPTWISSVVDRMLMNLRDGNPANDGQPAGWDAGQYGDWNTLAQTAKYPAGVPQSVTYQLYDFVQDTQDPSTLNWAQSQVGARPAPSPTDYTQTLTISEQLALRDQNLQESDYLRKLISAGTPARSTSSGGGSSRIAGSSSGGGSSGTDYGARLGYDAASADIDAQLAREKFELQKELMLLQFQLDNDPNNPELKLKQQQLDESIRQFNATLAQKTQAEEKALQLQRAKTVADYGANPGDAVAREYFLRQGANPTGNAVNIFTGQPAGQQMTLSEVMQNNAPIVSPALQGAMAGTPAPTEPAPEEEPQYAFGTRRPDPKVTPDGWTRAPEFIAGDPQMPGMVNPEKIQMRVKNGRPEAKVTPLSQMMGGGVRRRGGPMAQMSDRMPMFATGTDDPWAWMYESPEAAPAPIDPWAWLSSGSSLAQPQSAPTTAKSSTYTLDPTKPWAPGTGGVPAQIGSTGLVNDDPYYGTQYAGMSGTDPILNGNSPYYGMTVDAAMALQTNADRAPAGYVVGPDAYAPTWDMYDSGYIQSPLAPTGYVPANQDMKTGAPLGGFVQVNNQADAGILTGAQLSKGATQNVNPTLAGYVSPVAPPPQPTDTGQNIEVSDTGEAPAAPAAEEAVQDVPSFVLDEATGQWVPNTMGASPPETTTGPAGATTTDGVKYGPATSAGSSVVISGGTVKSPDGGATYTLQPNDVKQADGTYIRYNPLRQSYEPVLPQYTKIGSADEFFSLPPEVQQKILTGQQTGYALVEENGTQWIAGLTTRGFDRQAPLSEEQFGGLPQGEQRALYEGTSKSAAQFGDIGYQPPSQDTYTNQLGPLMSFPTGLLTLPQPEFQQYTQDYSPYVPPELYNQLYPPQPPTPITPIYPAGYEPSPTGGTPPPPATPPPATPPPAGTTTPPPGGTTAPPPAGTTAPPPAGGTTTPPPASGQDALAQALAQLLGLSYGNETYQNLPALQYAMGNLTGGEYDTVSNAPIEVPGLGLSLPGASQMMNYEMLQKLIENGSFDLLNSLYTAGNVPLSLILAMSRARAPLGSASESSLIETT